MLDQADWNDELSRLPPDVGSAGAVVLLAAFAPRSPVPGGKGVRRFSPSEHPIIERIVHDSAKPRRGQKDRALSLGGALNGRVCGASFGRGAA